MKQPDASKVYRSVLALAIVLGVLAFGMGAKALLFTRSPISIQLILDLPESHVFWEPVEGFPLSFSSHPSAYIIQGERNSVRTQISGSSLAGYLGSTVVVSATQSTPITVTASQIAIVPDDAFSWVIVADVGTAQEFDEKLEQAVRELGRSVELESFPPPHRWFGLGFRQETDIQSLSGSEIRLLGLTDLDFVLTAKGMDHLSVLPLVDVDSGFTVWILGDCRIDLLSNSYVFEDEVIRLEVQRVEQIHTEPVSEICDVELLYPSPTTSGSINAQLIEVFDAKGTLSIGAGESKVLPGLGHYIRISRAEQKHLNNLWLNYTNTHILVRGSIDNMMWNDTQLVQTGFEKLPPDVQAALYAALFSAIGFLASVWIRWHTTKGSQLLQGESDYEEHRDQLMSPPSDVVVFHLVNGEILAASSYTVRGMFKTRYILHNPLCLIGGEWRQTQSKHRTVLESAIAQFYEARDQCW